MMTPDWVTAPVVIACAGALTIICFALVGAW
jgi:hypothetical protein